MRIGLVTPWFERGLAYVGLSIYKALKDNHTVFVLAKPGKRGVGPEWDVLNVETGNYSNPSNWASNHNLEILIFFERRDYRQIARIHQDFKTVGYMDWEMVDLSLADQINEAYNAIIAPTRCAREAFNAGGIGNVWYVPWGVDLNYWTSLEKPDYSPVEFFHPAGYGGVAGRRGTKEVRIAFAKSGVKSNLLVTSQKGDGITTERENIVTIHGTLPQERLAGLYRTSDVALLPSKWEGLGLTFLEALASGLAIITVDAAPMNEYVVDGWNGFLCKNISRPGPRGIQVEQAIIDIGDFIEKIKVLSEDSVLTREMGRNSRTLAEDRFDWTKNSNILLERVKHGMCD